MFSAELFDVIWRVAEKGETGGGDTIRCGSDRTWDGRGEKLRISQRPAPVEAGRIECVPLSVEGTFQDPQSSTYTQQRPFIN